MIVGNAAIDSRHTSRIDGADLVIRFNDCRSAGAGGTRTDIVAVCNTGRPGKAMVEDPEWRSIEAVRQARAIWAVRDPAKFAAMRPHLAVSHPELDDFCDDYTNGFVDFAGATGKDFHAIAARIHEDLDQTLADFDASTYVTPSSGAIVIAEVLTHVLKPEDDLTIAGFSHEGWQWHPWKAEAAWVDSLSAAGTLNRL
jgi:hypothetical protein